MSMPISSMVDCSTRATQQGNMFSLPVEAWYCLLVFSRVPQLTCIWMSLPGASGSMILSSGFEQDRKKWVTWNDADGR